MLREDFNLITFIVTNLLKKKEIEKYIYDYIFLLLKYEVKRYLIINNNNNSTLREI